MDIRLGGRNFAIATDKAGNPRVTVASRPSQPDDGSAIKYAVWRTDGDDLNSFEVIAPGGFAGYLGRDYGAGTDGRWLGCDTLGPLISTIDLSTYDNPLGAGLLGGDAQPGMLMGGGAQAGGGMGPAEQTQDSDAYAQIATSQSTYGYVTRGMRPAKIDLNDMTLKESGVVFDVMATDIINTTPASTAVRSEISVGLGDDNAYEVLQLAGVGVPPATDTWVANDATEATRVFGTAPDRTVLIAGNVVKGNIQTGTVTMESPNWQTVTTLTTQNIRGTGFALDGNLWVIGTTDGPYMLDESSGLWFPIMPELDLNDANCRNMQEIFGIGTVIPLELAIRHQRYGAGASFGPETFPGNTSPVQGTVTGLAGSPREMFTAIFDPCGCYTFLVVWKPQEGDHDRGARLYPYVIARFEDTPSDFLSWIGTVNGLRANPTLMGGYGSDAFWITCGRTARWIDDANYRYALSGQTYLTEMRRERNVLVDVEYIEGELSGTMDDNKTVGVYLSLDGGSYTQIGETQTSTGFKRFIASSAGVPVSAFQSKHRAKPRIDYSSDSSSAVPQWVGPLTMAYRTRPTEINIYRYVIDLPTDNVDTAYGYEEFLHNLSLDIPQEFESHDRQNLYVRVKSVEFDNIDAVGNSAIDSRGLRRQATVTLEEWTTS